MTVRKCDMCGAEIHQPSPYENIKAAKIAVSVAYEDPFCASLIHDTVDLCDDCQSLVYDFIFSKNKSSDDA